LTESFTKLGKLAKIALLRRFDPLRVLVATLSSSHNSPTALPALAKEDQPDTLLHGAESCNVESSEQVVLLDAKHKRFFGFFFFLLNAALLDVDQFAY
jgi:uncharacterized protein (DUF58 family)